MKNFLKIVRWKNLIIIAISMLLMRRAIIIPIYDYFQVDTALSQTGFLFLVLSVIFLMSGGNAINDYFDRRTDTINRPKEVLVGFSIKRRQVIFMHFVFSLFGIICGFITSNIIGRTSFGFFFIIAAIVIWMYSTKFKRKALLGNLIAAILTGCVPLLVGLFEYYSIKFSICGFTPEYDKAIILILYIISGFALFALLYSFIYGIVKDCINYEGDKEMQLKTIPVLIGKKKTNYVIGLVSLIVLALVVLSERVFLQEVLFFQGIAVNSLYIYIFVFIPTVILAICSFVGTRKRKYIFLKRLIKIIMLFGIILSLIFNFVINEYIS